MVKIRQMQDFFLTAFLTFVVLPSAHADYDRARLCAYLLAPLRHPRGKGSARTTKDAVFRATSHGRTSPAIVLGIGNKSSGGLDACLRSIDFGFREALLLQEQCDVAASAGGYNLRQAEGCYKGCVLDSTAYGRSCAHLGISYSIPAACIRPA